LENSTIGTVDRGRQPMVIAGVKLAFKKGAKLAIDNDVMVGN